MRLIKYDDVSANNWFSEKIVSKKGFSNGSALPIRFESWDRRGRRTFHQTRVDIDRQGRSRLSGAKRS